MKNSILILPVLFLFFSCHKDKIEYYEQYITGGSSKEWTIKSLILTGEPEELDDCAISNKFIFVVDYTYNTQQNNSLCQSPSSSGTWSIRADTLLLDGFKYRIDLLTPRKLEYSDFLTNASVSYKR